MAVEKVNLAAMVRLLTTEELRILKQQITEELSKRHKEKEDEKCSCWTCHHCFFDKNAHKSYPKSSDYRGDYKCMAWSKKGRIIPTKHKAPVWCPLGERPYYYYGKRKENKNA